MPYDLCVWCAECGNGENLFVQIIYTVLCVCVGTLIKHQQQREFH